VALLTFTMLVFPQVSFDYKLLHLLLPVGLFLAAPTGQRDTFYAVCLGLLLVPKAYGWLTHDVSVSVLLNPLLMTVVGVALIRDCWTAPAWVIRSTSPVGEVPVA
jgi:hypothetical protein